MKYHDLSSLQEGLRSPIFQLIGFCDILHLNETFGDQVIVKLINIFVAVGGGFSSLIN